MDNEITSMDRQFYHEALKEAKKSLSTGGIPIGSVLAYKGKIIGRGHNQRMQKASAILHGEMDALENAGRIQAKIYRECTLYTTLSPCSMCSGTILLYNIPRVVIGENINFTGDEKLLTSRGVKLFVLQDQETILMMEKFINENAHLWNEDIGEITS